MGQRLDSRFENLRVLLDDSYGKLLLGEDVDSGTPVVVDLLDLGGEPGANEEQAFRQQVSSLIEAGLPALPVLVEAENGEDGFAIVWSHEGFVPLRMKLEAGSDLSLAQALDVIYQIADALSSASSDEHLHLDLSPNSVWVGESGEGLAVRIYRYGVHHLFPKYAPGFRGSVFWGTAEYMAPEMCSGKDASIAADLYSAGILLVEMLTGEPPFRSANPRTTLKRQIYEKPLPLRLAKPELPGVQKLDEILSGILAKSPAKRLDNPETLKEQLEAYRAEFLPDFVWTHSGMDAAEDTSSLGTDYEAPVREIAPVEEPKVDEEDEVVTLVLGGAAEAADPEPVEDEKPEPAAVSPVEVRSSEEETRVDIPAMEESEEVEDKAVKTTTIQKPVPSEIIEAGVGSVGAPFIEEGVPGAGEPSEDLSEWFSQPADAMQPQEPSFHAHVKKDSHLFFYFVGAVALLLGVAMYFLMDRSPQPKKGRVTYMPVAELGGGDGDFASDENFLPPIEKDEPPAEKPEDSEKVAAEEVVEEEVEEQIEEKADDESDELVEAELAEEEPAEEPEEDGDPELAAAEALNKGGEAEENGDAAMEDGRYDDAIRFYEAAIAAMPENASVGAKLLKAKGAQEAKEREAKRLAKKKEVAPKLSPERREELAAQREARKAERAEKAEQRRLAREEAKEKRRLAREEAAEKRRLKAEERAAKKAERAAKRAEQAEKKAAEKKAKKEAAVAASTEKKKAAEAAKIAAAAKKAELAKKVAVAPKAVKTGADDAKAAKAAAAKSALKKAVSAMKAKDYSGAKKAFKEAKSLGASEIIVNKYLKLISKKLKK